MALTNPALFINREVSWLAFNERVLAQATGPEHPLLERVKFLAIVATNLEEFFMIRVAALLRKARAGRDDCDVDGLRTPAALRQVRTQVGEMLRRQATCWRETLRPDLEAHGIRVLEPREYTPELSAFLAAYFETAIAPGLKPRAFATGRRAPLLANLSQNLAVVVTTRRGGTRLVRITIPYGMPRFIRLPPSLWKTGGDVFVYVEDMIRANLQTLLPRATIAAAYLFRVVHDADLIIQDDDADDLLISVGKGLKQRRGAIAMLQVEAATPPDVVDRLMAHFNLDDEQTYRLDSPIGFGDWMALANLPRPDLRYAPLVPVSIWPAMAPGQIFDELRLHDLLIHHPFQSFDAVEAFIRAAVTDPLVDSIKITLYRIGTDSPLVDLLVQAARAGKQVTVLVELKARFDEQNNIKWATELEAAGAHVAYGLPNLKTHAKVCLVTRREGDDVRGYAHVGTGNYNAQTASAYTDLGLFTARPSIVEDASELFYALTGHTGPDAYREFLVAPRGLRSGLIALIDHEAGEARTGRPARIIIKVNSLTDSDVIQALYRASRAGVRVDLIVRGVCGLRPGVAGVSETITVRSIVGRFLEHSRIFWFQNGAAPRVFIGSADIMERSFDRRVEVLCPVHDPSLIAHLREVVLGVMLQDVRRTRILQPDGTYQPAVHAERDVPPLDAQAVLVSWHADSASTR